MRNKAKANYVLTKTEGVFGEIMHEVEKTLMSASDTDEAIREVIVIVARGFRDFETKLAQYLIEGEPF